MGQAAPFWRFSVESYPDLEVKRPSESTLSTASKTTNDESEESLQVGNCNSHHSYNFSCIYFFLHHCNNIISFIFTWIVVLFEFFSCIQQKSTRAIEYSLFHSSLVRLFFSDLVLMGIYCSFY
jgi:hypothetical protein